MMMIIIIVIIVIIVVIIVVVVIIIIIGGQAGRELVVEGHRERRGGKLEDVLLRNIFLADINFKKRLSLSNGGATVTTQCTAPGLQTPVKSPL